MADFKEFLTTLSHRINFILDFYSKDSITFSYDYLQHSSQGDHEVLFSQNEEGEEHSSFFIFGSEFFVCDLGEQEFKRYLALNSLNFKILRAYKELRKKQEHVKITDILNYLHDSKKDSLEIHGVLRRILTLAYYLNWDLKKDSSDIEGDSFVEIPDKFLFRLKQRFSYENMCSVYENDEFFVFLNTRGKLNIVFKNKDEFTRRDIERILPKLMNKLFGTQECHFK